MLGHIIMRLLKWIWDQLDTVLALLLAAVCSILGILGAVQPSILASATLATLTVLAFALMRDRLEREKLQSRLSQLTMRFDEPSPDFFFKQGVDETSILKDAEREVLMVQETGAYIIETKKALIMSLLRRGGIVRIVVASPKEEITREVAFRNHDFTYDAITNRSNLFRSHIDSIIREIGADAERLQVRFIPYLIDTLSVIVDPNSPIEKKRRAIVRYAGFRTPFEERFGINIQGDTSPKLFSHYHQEAQRLFEHASKIILLTGASRSGKTTAMAKLMEGISVEDRTYIFFVISRAIWKGNKHIGFEVVTSSHSEPRSFATRLSEGNFEFNEEVWASVTSELETAYEERKILVLDEIAPLQLRNSSFLGVVEKILDDPNTFMFATLPLDDRSIPSLRKIKLHYRSTVLRLTSNEMERTKVENTLEQELKTALQVRKFMPHML